MASSLGRLILGEHPAYLRYVDRVRQFGSDEQLVIAFEEPDLSSPRVLDRLQRIVDTISAIDEVARVDSILAKVQQLHGELEERREGIAAALAQIQESARRNQVVLEEAILAAGNHG